MRAHSGCVLPFTRLSGGSSAAANARNVSIYELMVASAASDDDVLPT